MATHIAVAGNIGAGKTTLTGMLADHYQWTPLYEEVDENPYLVDFYEDMRRWSFNLQIFFLDSRFRQILNIRQSQGTIIQDRTIYEDAYIFATNLHSMGLMSSRDFDSYRNLFEGITSLVRPPELIIYLKASVPTLVRQIQKRGREYESSIRLDYLSRLNEHYENWVSGYTLGPLVTIDADYLHFEEDPESMKFILREVDKQLSQQGITNRLPKVRKINK